MRYPHPPDEILYVQTARNVRCGMAARRRRLLRAVTAIALLFAVGACGTANSTPSQATPSKWASPATAFPTPSETETPGPTPTASPAGEYADLDGVLTATDVAHRVPIAVMIDDLDAARPQAGLSTASIVYHSPVNGGVDRYMAIYQEGEASDIGPVRSARPYFVKWASEYHSVLSHYGSDLLTTTTVLPALTEAGAVYDLDGLAGYAGAYHRIDARPAPHNVYTSSATLRQSSATGGYPATFADVPTRPFADGLPLNERPASGSIAVPYHDQTIGYTYDRSTDSYLRDISGKAEIDSANGRQVVAHNVIVLFQSVATDFQPGDNYLEPVVGLIGTGNALVFRDGLAISATWRKANDTDLTRLYDSSGQQITLVRGEIFIQVVGIGTDVTYKLG
jgi:hypothetical protein